MAYATMSEKLVVFSVVPGTPAASRCPLDAAGSSVAEVDPRAVVQSSVCIGSE